LITTVSEQASYRLADIVTVINARPRPVIAEIVEGLVCNRNVIIEASVTNDVSGWMWIRVPIV
jgi:hypothetical protein